MSDYVLAQMRITDARGELRKLGASKANLELLESALEVAEAAVLHNRSETELDEMSQRRKRRIALENALDRYESLRTR